SVLQNEPGPARDIVTLNAGAAIYAANITESLTDGYAKAGGKKSLRNKPLLGDARLISAITPALPALIRAVSVAAKPRSDGGFSAMIACNTSMGCLIFCVAISLCLQ
ncbi:hypothetical protein TI03_07445, partial [Achromatium sp. WMS1]